jgi:type II restriction enzyme
VAMPLRRWKINRRHEVQQQLRRPAFSREAIARFGSGIKPVMEISQAL